MPRSFDVSADYVGTVEQILEALGDERYWLQRLAQSGADVTTLDSLTIDAAGGIDVTTTQTLRADRLPGVVTQFHRGDLSFVREERWSAVADGSDGSADAAVSGSIPGAPAKLAGTAVLSPTESGSRLQLAATVEVRIPLVGGKVENFIGSQLKELLTAEQRFTTAWIRENA